MSKVEFKLNWAGVGQLLKSDGAMRACEAHAKRIQERCGPGYEVTTHRGKSRVNASVGPVTAEARQENYENNTLEKALY